MVHLLHAVLMGFGKPSWVCPVALVWGLDAESLIANGSSPTGPATCLGTSPASSCWRHGVPSSGSWPLLVYVGCFGLYYCLEINGPNGPQSHTTSLTASIFSSLVQAGSILTKPSQGVEVIWEYSASLICRDDSTFASTVEESPSHPLSPVHRSCAILVTLQPSRSLRKFVARISYYFRCCNLTMEQSGNDLLFV